MTEETPTKIILKKNKSEQGGEGCTYAAIAVTIALILVSVFAGLAYFNSSRSWLFWTITAAALLIEVLFVYLAVLMSPRNNVHEATVSIDLDTQQATRIEKLNSGKIQKYSLRLEQVSRISIHGEDAGHRLEVTLDSQNSLPLKVNSDVFFDPEPMKALGNKIGKLLKKPVVLKITDQGKIVSEEIIQDNKQE
ncbi:MAG: DUF1772 domain-containing protein [Chloroflexi bacterium]|nr:DUF1772 domain-containing protein [Chloroflexota bacterium]MBI3339783.1 DUF1772 domain-containing protein [Chloroflexota bacterium]